MPANTNYNDRYTIERVISIIQDTYSDVGDYVTHAPSNGGVRVQLTNGRILVTYAAIEDVDYYQDIPKYADYMYSTFLPNQQPISNNKTVSNKISWYKRILRFFGLK